MRKEIEHIDDVKSLVDNFYGKVREDDLIGPIFNQRLEGRWPQHLQKMYSFWQTVLLRQHTYNGYPFRPHANLPVETEHFNRWLELWFFTLTSQFEGENVEIAKRQAMQMAKMFQMKIEHNKQLKKQNINDI